MWFNSGVKNWKEWKQYTSISFTYYVNRGSCFYKWNYKKSQEINTVRNSKTADEPHCSPEQQKKIFKCHHESFKSQINAYYRHSSTYTVHLIQICGYNLEYQIKNFNTAVTIGCYNDTLVYESNRFHRLETLLFVESYTLIYG